MMIEITIIGLPAPQGSKKAIRNKYTGTIQLKESSAKVKPWREAVVWAAREAMQEQGWKAPVGPVCCSMTFTMRKPKSAPKRRRTYPDRTPDLSKLVRSTEDALTTAGIWEDDARVISLGAHKVYPLEERDALDVPGAVIRVWVPLEIEQPITGAKNA